ncbi:hypothetical protein CMO91_01110 [Candidatus Woesearchaeota archaeon]|nr:hypothetical protein [Candidatus Woesearchaeota archaeon]
MIVIGGSNSQDLARKVARKLKANYRDLVVRKFPDGELYLRLPPKVKGQRVVIVNTMHPNPNDALIELFLSWHTAKEMGAKKVSIVVPYMGYLRQDKRFHPGESLSNHLVASLLSPDFCLTLDPHLHRIHSLKEIFKTKAKHVTANDVLGDYIKKNMKGAIIVGPDGESFQWADHIAKRIGHHAIVLKKKRFSSRKVKIVVHSDVPLEGKTVVLVDDIISSGHTMLEPIKQFKKMGVKNIYCMCVHGVFAEGALKKIQKLGAKVLSTNSVNNPVAKIDVSSLIAEQLR